MLNDRTALRPNSYGIVSGERTLIMRRCRGDGRLWNLDIPVSMMSREREIGRVSRCVVLEEIWPRLRVHVKKFKY